MQVDVRVIEASHSAIRDLGFNLNVQGLNAGIQLLDRLGAAERHPPQATFGVNHQFGAWNIDANLAGAGAEGRDPRPWRGRT